MSEIEDRPTIVIEAPNIGCEHCFAAIYGQAETNDAACLGCRRRVMARFAHRNRPRENTRPEPVDFSFVPEHQQVMHGRLENWGRACIGGGSGDCAPMFRQYQSAQHWDRSYSADTLVPLDRGDSTLIGRGVYMLPAPHMKALQWCYVQRTSVMKGRRSLACTAEALAKYVIDGRQMLINRGV